MLSRIINVSSEQRVDILRDIFTNDIDLNMYGDKLNSNDVLNQSEDGSKNIFFKLCPS